MTGIVEQHIVTRLHGLEEGIELFLEVITVLRIGDDFDVLFVETDFRKVKAQIFRVSYGAAELLNLGIVVALNTNKKGAARFGACRSRDRK